MSESKVAASIREELTNPASEGERHTQMLRVVIPLLKIGLEEGVLFAQLRGMYKEDLPDEEIKAIITWGKRRLPQQINEPSPSRRRIAPPEEALKNAIAYMDGFEIDEASLWDASKIRPGANWTEDSLLLLANFYRPTELVAINSNYKLQTQRNDSKEKVVIQPPEQTLSASDWIDRIRVHGTPQSDAGAWIRLNPLKNIQGSGFRGMHTDEDVAAYRYLLLESDSLPSDVWLSVLAKLPFPIATISTTAGRAPHGWLLMPIQTQEYFTRATQEVFSKLAPLGIDDANKNPSRYGRLPGAKRTLGAQSDEGRQRLLYANPSPHPGGIFHEYFGR